MNKIIPQYIYELSFHYLFLRSLYLFVLHPAILLKFTKTKLVAVKIISFDLISDASDDQTAKLRLFGSTAPPIPWEPSFCVLREDVKTLTFHKQEEVTSASLCSKNKQKFRVIFLDTLLSFDVSQGADELPGLVVLRKKRLDDGKQEFDKRWGFETLKSIQENARQHQDEHLLHPPQACSKRCLKFTVVNTLMD